MPGKIILSRPQTIAEEHNWLNENQHGFRPNKQQQTNNNSPRKCNKTNQDGVRQKEPNIMHTTGHRGSVRQRLAPKHHYRTEKKEVSRVPIEMDRQLPQPAQSMAPTIARIGKFGRSQERNTA